MSLSSSAAESPVAYAAPTIDPIDVPAMQSIGTRSSSSTLMTPMCAAPLAPPPPRTRPMRGRAAPAGAVCAVGADAGGSAAIAAASHATRCGRDEAAKDQLTV
jgi:hypothetical protein